MTEGAPGRLWSGIDIPKTIATVLAAVSAAVIGSYLGVAGTLAGAAVASLISSVGTEVYHNSIRKGRSRLKGTFVAAPAAVGTPPVAAVPDDPPAGPPRRMRWGRVAMVAAAVFVLAMGTLTVAELLGGRSIADVTRGGSGDRSTVSTFFDDDSGEPDQSPSSPAPSEQPTDDTTTTPPTGDPTTEPTSDPTTEPTSDPTTAPETVAPTGGDTGDTDSGSGGGGGTDGAGDTANRTE